MFPSYMMETLVVKGLLFLEKSSIIDHSIDTDFGTPLHEDNCHLLNYEKWLFEVKNVINFIWKRVLRDICDLVWNA